MTFNFYMINMWDKTKFFYQILNLDIHIPELQELVIHTRAVQI